MRSLLPDGEVKFANALNVHGLGGQFGYLLFLGKLCNRNIYELSLGESEHIITNFPNFCNYMFMSKDSNVKTMLPAAVLRNLQQLGEHIHIARKRRKESLAAYAARMQISIPTLRKLEAGDPSVSMAAYATALWVIGRVHFLGEIANPEADEMALLQELRTIKKPKAGSR